MKIKIIKKQNLEEMSGVGGMAGYAQRNSKQEESKELEEICSISASKMVEAGMKHIDPTPEQEEERYKMNYSNKGLQNYKPNPCFNEEKNKTKKIRIKKQKK